MSKGKALWKFLSSMRFAMVLLGVLCLACVAGSVVTQGESAAWYAARYPERTAAAILALGLDDVFHSWWFLTITGFLCLNLLFCNVLRLPVVLRRFRAAGDPAAAGESAALTGETDRDPAAVFSALCMPAPRRTETAGEELLFSSKNRLGYWGAWICHVGVLLLILGFTLGQMTHEEYAVYGVPGDTLPVGETGLSVTIRDFAIDLREDDTVRQYTADILVRQGEEDPGQQASVSVNHPARIRGLTFYQNSTGWAANITVSKNGAQLQSDVVCVGEVCPVRELPELTVYLNAFYPDYVWVEGEGPATRSGRLQNPAWLYSIYYGGNLVGMNLLFPEETISIDDYRVNITDPQAYTLLQIKRDRFTPLALAGGILTALGLGIALYLPPVRVWARRRDPDAPYQFFADSPRSGPLLREHFALVVGSEEKSPPATAEENEE